MLCYVQVECIYWCPLCLEFACIGDALCPNFVSIDIVQYCENISFRIIMGKVCELRDKIYISPFVEV